MKNWFAIPLLLLSFAAQAQSLKPVAQMVADARREAALPEAALFDLQSTNVSDVPGLSASVKAGAVLAWDEGKANAFKGLAKSPVSLVLPFEGGQFKLDLVPARNFSPSFEVKAASGDEAAKQIDYGQHYWGTVEGDPNSLVSISVFDNEVMGFIAVGKDRYNLGVMSEGDKKVHVLYKESDLLEKNPFSCGVDELEHKIEHGQITQSRSVGPDNCVRMYVEADYTIFQNKGSVAAAAAYVTGVFSQVSALYTNESINLVLHSLLVWDVADPYTGPSSSNYLTQFRTALNGNFNGDLAHLVGFTGGGGVAYLDVLCFPSYGVGYSGINTTYNNVPTYSWTVEVVTHEIGHNLGSPHTHACSWNGNNTPIDGCGPTAGYSEGCTGPLPTAGTIMSYCHLVSGVGIDFNLGFGPQPGNLIRDNVYNAPCLSACGGGGGGCSYTGINSNNFDAGWGIWVDGGTDCARINNATYANSPTFSIQLRDNTATSVMSTGNQNYANYDELTVTFSYITVSFDNSNEDFWVQKSTNGGTTYTTVGDFNFGTQFVNGVRQTGTVVIPGPFTATTRLRFRCDASADDDQVYIDDVVVTGCLQQNRPGVTLDRTGPETLSATDDAVLLSGLQLGPNPAQDQLNLRFQAAADMDVQCSIVDLTGRSVLAQSWKAVEGDNQQTFPLSNLSNGLYIVQLRAGDVLLAEKLVVSK